MCNVPYCTTPDCPISDFLCHCGCGNPTKIADRSRPQYGHVKGAPRLYLAGHSHLRDIPQYIEEDMGHGTPCWIWQGRRTKLGYGVLSTKSGTSKLAHKVLYEAWRGPIPEGKEPDHRCEVPACVNPDHLEPVTHAVNIRRSKRAKITMEQARMIRAGTPRTDAVFAKQFGLNVDYVSHIRQGARWLEGKE